MARLLRASLIHASQVEAIEITARSLGLPDSISTTADSSVQRAASPEPTDSSETASHSDVVPPAHTSKLWER